MAETKTKKSTAAKKTATSVAIPKTTSKVDNETKERLKEFLGKNLDGMMKDFEELSPSKKWDLVIQLLPYVTPKMQATEIGGGVDFDPLSTQLGQLANKLVKND